jgi:hypothetical protein
LPAASIELRTASTASRPGVFLQLRSEKLNSAKRREILIDGRLRPAIALRRRMGTIKVLLSILLCLLILAAVPAVRAEADQCTASLPIVSTTGHASAGDECHVRSTPEKHPLAPRVLASGNGSMSPAMCWTGIRPPQSPYGAAAARLDPAIHQNIPVFLRKVALLI